jgi:hypothetical protein
VASVNDDKTSQALRVLRYELETFVCDGQYEKGIAHILETYLKNIGQSQQPAVWVSGFFGSGKSHLVKMLRSLWEDTVFEDGATARGIVNLSQNIKDLFKELTTQSRRYGGLHAVSGTLGAGASGSVRLSLLRLIFKSVGLPEQYGVAKFLLWLKAEGLYEIVQDHIKNNGDDWEVELDNFYVAEGLHKALVATKPNIFSTDKSCADVLINLYPNVSDISSDEMIKIINRCLMVENKLPLTLIVLDEIQQYIGEDSQRSIEVQELVEACCKNIGSNLLFIGTGQTAVTGTSNLKRLEGRFTIRVELSDADVDAVIRQVILAKKPEAKASIEEVMNTNLGEISRHLSGTMIGHQNSDLSSFVQDYPILPVRRRFWENTLRVLDQTGTDSQLRNQLSMIHKVIQTNVHEPIGSVVPTDYLYFDAADKLLQARILPRKIHEKTMSWYQGSSDQQLIARACGLVFLINKLVGSNREIGIQATVDTLADLLVTNLLEGSGVIRGKLAGLLDQCDILMRVGDEYRIQTEESAAWNDEFLRERHDLANQSHRIEEERNIRIRHKLNEVLKNLAPVQGDSKVPRDLSPIYANSLPSDSEQKLSIWVRDGWNSDEKSVKADAKQAGTQSPTVFVFIPKGSADDLRRYLMEYKASYDILKARGVSNTPEGVEARAAMETTKRASEEKIRELLDEAFTGARVFQGGGTEILGNDLREMIKEAVDNALQRSYPQFAIADHVGWAKVYEKAHKGDPDALKAVGENGETAQNSVCKAVLSFIGGGKKGSEIRQQFEFPPYGWSKDAIEGSLQALLVSGLVRGQDERGKPIDAKELERKAIAKTLFKVEATTITTPQRIQIRKLFQKMGMSCKPGEELIVVPKFLEKLNELVNCAGGEAPQPTPVDTHFLEKIRLAVGNEQLSLIYDRRDELSLSIDDWTRIGERIKERSPQWLILKRLLDHSNKLPDQDGIRLQVQQIEEQRLLLEEPDPITPLVNNLSQLLRQELNRLNQAYEQSYQAGLQNLEVDGNWQSLNSNQQEQLLFDHSLDKANSPQINVQTTEAILTTLDKISLVTIGDRLAALSSCFESVMTEAAKLQEPECQFVQIPRRTLKTGEDIDRWVNEVKEKLQAAIEKGPVILQ